MENWTKEDAPKNDHYWAVNPDFREMPRPAFILKKNGTSILQFDTGLDLPFLESGFYRSVEPITCPDGWETLSSKNQEGKQ